MVAFVLVLVTSTLAWAQVTPAPQPAPVVVGSHLLDWVILAAAALGAFLKRASDDAKVTKSWATLAYVFVSAGVTYLALDTGMLPDAWEAAAVANPIKAAVVAFIASNLAGAGLVMAAQGLLSRFAPAADPPKP